jgi:hypothetical protein
VVLVERGTGVRPPFEGSAVLFRGCGAPAVREWVAQCRGADTGHIAQCRIVVGMASPGGFAEQRRDMTPRHVRGMACVDSSLTWVPADVRALNAPVGGAGTEAASPREPRARRRLARGGDQPSSEADLTRRGVRPSSEADPARGGVQPLSEAEPHLRGRPALERGGTSPEGATGPRARQNLTRGASSPREAGFC